MGRWGLVSLLVFLAFLVPAMALNSGGGRLEQLARNGEIQRDAPVKASLEIVIEAPVEKVWSLLTDVKGWPAWQTNIAEAEIAGPVRAGTRFAWNAGGARIKSRIALVQPYERFAWTGSAFNAKAIHVWKLERLPGNKTRIRTDESMSGFMLTLFYSSKELEQSDRLWLDRLKLAAEQGR